MGGQCTMLLFKFVIINPKNRLIMKTAKICFLIIVSGMLSVNTVHSQIKVHNDNNVSGGTIDYNPSPKCYVYNPNTGNGLLGLYALKAQPGVDWYYGMALQGYTYSGRGYSFGVRAFANNSTDGAGRAWGVYGYADRASSGYNYGVMG